MNNYVLTEYQISSRTSSEQTLIALLADLHEQGTEEIVELVRSVSPDLICIAGDTFERSEKNKDKKHLEPRYETSCSRGERMIQTFFTQMDQQGRADDPYIFHADGSCISPFHQKK